MIPELRYKNTKEISILLDDQITRLMPAIVNKELLEQEERQNKRTNKMFKNVGPYNLPPKL